ncbi:hypothetical protein Vafri_12667 [Volvox africanus]|uniref:Uncharacterized protein n=1 Tax=Volvox africanus TaxID=51714 RepID=A0A8J4BF02_9CHLO|nr:hypothetical protein Vafri_12667 [Volvox africanus]
MISVATSAVLGHCVDCVQPMITACVPATAAGAAAIKCKTRVETTPGMQSRSQSRMCGLNAYAVRRYCWREQPPQNPSRLPGPSQIRVLPEDGITRGIGLVHKEAAYMAEEAVDIARDDAAPPGIERAGPSADMSSAPTNEGALAPT